jgi:RNA recognition motif-containing protein
LHNLAVQNIQQEEAKRSIFVRNFPTDKTNEQDLKEAFQTFGAVKKVVVNDKSVYAIVEFQSAQTALDVLQHSEPVLIHGARLTVKPRTAKVVQGTPNLTHEGDLMGRDSKRLKADPEMATKKHSFGLHKKILEVMTTANSVNISSI